jgi:cytochrome b561
MQLRNSTATYGLVSQSLHWIIAGLIVYQYALAQLASNASLFQQLVLIARHKSVGLTVLLLTLLRLAWRLANPRVAPPPEESVNRRIVARATHDVMYALLVALPVTGLLMSAAANVPVRYFGWFTVPSVITPRESWVEPLEQMHATLFNTLFVIVVVHVAAALYHQFVLHDVVLKRMIPGFGRDEQ